MTQTKKPIRPEPELEDRILKDDELDAVSGGSPGLFQSAFSNTIKSIGEALSTAARKG